MRSIILALALAAGAMTATAQPVVPVPVLQPGEALLEVEATGEIKSAPDQAMLSAGVVTQAETARAAIEANSRQAERLVAAIRNAGVEPRDIQTTALQVLPRYSQPDRQSGQYEPRIVGYDARNSVMVRFRDLKRLPALYDAMTAAGANQIDGPNFGLADPRPVQLQARAAAVANARAQADALAAAAGLRVARILRLSERAQGAPRPMPMARMAMAEAMADASAPPVEAGELVTSASVSIDYAVVPR